MNRFSKISIGLLMSLSLIACPGISNTVENIPSVYADEASTYSSYVFDGYSGYLTTEKCHVCIDLYDYGNVTIKLVLQRKNIFGNWYDYKTDDPGKTYYNVIFANHDYPYEITRSGSYRFKYTATGTVNGITQTTEGYSGVLEVQ